MKQLTLVFFFGCICCTAFTQVENSATACGSGCYVVTAQMRNDGACGGQNDYTFTVTNNSSQSLDIALFVEKRNGEWKSLGFQTNFASGRIIKDAFWSCNLSRRYVLYYRPAGSNDRFPTETEVNKRVRGY